MKKTYLLIAASVLFSLPSCSKKDAFQERIDDVNKGLFSILGSKPKDIYRCLGLQYGGVRPSLLTMANKRILNIKKNALMELTFIHMALKMV